MGKLSKRYRSLLNKVSKKLYCPKEGIALLKNLSTAKFTETAEIHIALGLQPKYPDQQLRATVTLPKGTGKRLNVAVITKGENLLKAKSAGADIIGSEELINEIIGGRLDFDKLIVTPDVMPLIARLGRILGPRGLMPSPKAGTVTNNLALAIAEFKAGKLEYRLDRTGIVHIPFGKTNFLVDDLITNLIVIRDSINKNRPSGSKGKYWKSVHLSSTMGPSIPLDINILREFK